jgi:S-formylglutathione hydrolase FrmB
MPVRRIGIAALAALLVALAAAAPAGASRLVTWETTSRFVDPNSVTFNGPPPGAPDLPPGLRVNVLLPDGYTPAHRYPVLYLLHGHGDRFDHWVNPQRGDVRDIAKGFQGIIVMPEADTGWYTNWWNGGQRGHPAWERYHLDELVPLVEARLPIRPGRRWHAIAGLSMGGEGAMYYAEQRPGYFGSAASFSGSISIQRPEWPNGMDTQGQNHEDVFGDPSAQRFYWTGHNPTALARNLRYTRLLVRVGDGVPNPNSQDEVTNYFGQVAELELHQHANDFVAAAQSVDDDVTYQPHQGIHDWPYWRKDLAAALKWGFFARVPERPAHWFFKTVSQTGWAWGLHFGFDQPPGRVERLQRDGDALEGRGSGTVRIRDGRGCSFTRALPFRVTLSGVCG